MIYIYGLIDRSAEVKGIRYIGLTSNPQSRLTAHRESTEATTKAAWINELALSGSTVDMVILDQAESREDAHRLEASWIKFAESRCWELTNTIRPSGECMVLPDVDSELPHVAPADFTWRFFDANTRMQDQIYDLRNDLLSIKTNMNKPPKYITVQAQAKPAGRNALVGVYRQCMIGAIALFAAQCVSIFNSIAGVDGRYVVLALIAVAFLMSIYPMAFMVKRLVMWLFGDQSVTVNGKFAAFKAGELGG